ncbi:Flp pilus assembly protein CpaB [Vibrio agarivorans]|uniref:Flp pilus assembly protein CpaB n=1 Tax=Vibrio agarivorans TaxID=153622 RepID=A0ABT7XX98_9VIBR|nr:Flp pilus assembly protein CpaB [Vibrio agarivorans]MDN2480398.1 Flp pilus assembly protein CpaB [Vibrio agarivorans]
MKRGLALVIALVAIVMGAFGIYSNLNKQEAPVQVAGVNEAEVYIQVWRAVSGLERGSALEATLVKREQVLRNVALEEGIRSDIELDFSPSTLLNTNVESGSLVLPEYQTKKGEPGYIDLLISEGKEPYPLMVSRTNLISGYIRPGIHVDVLSISSPKENLSGELKNQIEFNGVNASLLLQNVKVLGIPSEEGDESSQNANSSVRAEVPSEDEEQVVVIVEIDPREIARVSLAEKTMHLEVYRSNDYGEPVYADVRNVIENYSGVSELRGSKRQAVQGDEL